MFGVDRQELRRAGPLVIVGAARAEVIGGAAQPPGPLLPATEVAPSRGLRPAPACGAVQHMGEFMDQRGLQRAW
ncbi:hypothetical protein D3C72_2101120 [compost metagenome]